MPRAPLPPEFQPFISAARPAVLSTVRPDGSPVTTASWYDWENGRLLLSMKSTGPRIRNVRNNPHVALTILGDSWYDHVSISGRVVELREDEGLADLDRLSWRYEDKPYAKRHLECVTALVEIERWHAWGDPAAAAQDQAAPAQS